VEKIDRLETSRRAKRRLVENDGQQILDELGRNKSKQPGLCLSVEEEIGEIR
jgi:hypothetical protein